MTQFLAEWALRSSILIVCGALLIRVLRVKDPSLRLAAWTAILCGSLAIPALTAVLPKLPFVVMRVATVRVEAPVMVQDDAPPPVRPVPRPDARMDRPSPSVSPDTAAVPATPNSNVQVERHGAGISKHFDWALAAVMLYVLVALVLLLRLGFGLAVSLRLLRRSRVTGQATEGIQIRESDRVTAPVALGIVRPAIVLPGDWRQWDSAKMKAVLAHERSHIRRHDPAVQLLSAIHRVLLWPTPLSWFLHRQIVRVAEEVCDDAAVAVTRDRTVYAEVLLDFMRRGVWRANWQGVPISRYGLADMRIHRILDGTALSRGVTQWSLAAILTLGLPLAYVVAAANPQGAPSSTTHFNIAQDTAMRSGPALSGGIFVTPVPGAPFTALVRQEMTQVLADGSSFARKGYSRVSRDSAGLIRNELRRVLPPAPTQELRLLPIPLYDENTRVNLFLNPFTHGQLKPDVPLSPGFREEDLGANVMERVEVHGYRWTLTIPENVNGMGKPINVVNEHWYAEELHLDLLMKHSDPRTGSLVIAVENLKVGEPRSLKNCEELRTEEVGTRVPVPITPSCGASPPVVTPSAKKSPISDYVVRPEDQLNISVMDVPNVSQVYRVSPNGFLTLPLLPEPIPAAGKTVDQLSRRIATKLQESGLIDDAHVTVQRVSTGQESGEMKPVVYILGAVQKPGSYPLPQGKKLTIAEAVAQAGGLKQTAKRPARISLIRKIQNGTRAETSIDLNNVLEGKAVGPELKDGDILYVPTTNPIPWPLSDPPIGPSPEPSSGPGLASPSAVKLGHPGDMRAGIFASQRQSTAPASREAAPYDLTDDYPSDQTQGKAAPFVLQTEIYIYSMNPEGERLGTQTIARRSDGYTVLEDNFGPMMWGMAAAKVTYMAGTSVSVVDYLETKTTGPGTRLVFSRKRARGCVAAFETVMGHADIFGQHVVVASSTELPRHNGRLTEWRSLDLNCQTLAYQFDIRQADGSWQLMTKSKVVGLTPYEPDLQIFRVPRIYKGRTPREFQDALGSGSGINSNLLGSAARLASPKKWFHSLGEQQTPATVAELNLLSGPNLAKFGQPHQVPTLKLSDPFNLQSAPRVAVGIPKPPSGLPPQISLQPSECSIPLLRVRPDPSMKFVVDMGSAMAVKPPAPSCDERASVERPRYTMALLPNRR
jgi:protein involved in polysaccharide export with SLBB domain